MTTLTGYTGCELDGLLPVHARRCDLAREPMARHEIVDLFHCLLPATVIRTKANDATDRVAEAQAGLDRAERDAVVAALRRGAAHGRGREGR